MKTIILTALLVSGLTGVISQKALAQQDTIAKKQVVTKTTTTVTTSDGVTTTTTTKTDSTTTKDKKFKFSMVYTNKRDSTKKKPFKPGFMGGITFTRLDIGFSRLIDNGSFTLSPQNDFLDYRDSKTSTLSFDVLQFGYRFNPHFKVYVAGGFDWTLIRLKKNITIQGNQSDLTYINEPIIFSKNRFSSSYVHIPLNFELRSKENHNGKRFYFVFGPEVSFLLNGKVKQISDERGKEKIKDDYHFQSFRYGGTVRLGYGGIGLFTKYYFNDMFDSPAQAGLKNMSFGVSFGLN